MWSRWYEVKFGGSAGVHRKLCYRFFKYVGNEDLIHERKKVDDGHKWALYVVKYRVKVDDNKIKFNVKWASDTRDGNASLKFSWEDVIKREKLGHSILNEFESEVKLNELSNDFITF